MYASPPSVGPKFDGQVPKACAFQRIWLAEPLLNRKLLWLAEVPLVVYPSQYVVFGAIVAVIGSVFHASPTSVPTADWAMSAPGAPPASP